MNFDYNDQVSESFRNNDAFAECPEGKSRGVAGLLAILVGSLGIHYFYLGKTTAGILTILLCLVTCGAFDVLMLIQGILLLCMRNEDFRRKYVLSTSSFPLF
jgi:TM2 domain-containing membrane protein YozV